MYNNSFGGARRHGQRRSQSQGRSFGDSSRGDSARGGYGENRGNRVGFGDSRGRVNNFGGGRSGQRRNMPKRIDPRLFVNEQPTSATVAITPYEAQHSFADFAIDERLKQNIAHKNYTTPTPIQDQAIPVILEGSDVIGIANTGTGKTAAFLIPLINKVIFDPSQKILIVVPTRELAVQIKDELLSFIHGLSVRTVLTIGGANMFRQRQDLARPFNFLIGTPGRLKDLIQGRHLDLSTFHNVVLDEVDRMVDIGFIHDIRQLIALLPKERQSLFFSATVTDSVKSILNDFVRDPITISVKTANTAQSVEQSVVNVENGAKKIDLLHDLLIQDDFQKVIVFGRTKHGVEKISRELNARGFRTASIHGNKSQGQRQRALREFKNNTVNILLATDVASRGIDVDNVSHVINFDAPESYDDYVHRIGRTGRGDKSGVAITFVER